VLEEKKMKTKPNKQTDNWKSFVNPLIKQGNSYCIRVPGNIVKETNAVEGDLIAVKAQKLDLTPKEEHLNRLFEKVRPIKELNKFSDEKLMVMLMLLTRQGKLFLELKEYKTLISNEQIDAQKKKQYSDKVNQKLGELYVKIEKDFGKQFLEDYKYVTEIVGKKGLN
jgi:antitoxin component of MazEF toxin-antitoxin module